MNRQVHYSATNHLGRFNVLYEQLASDRLLWQTILGLGVVIEAFPHESGRGTTYILASEKLFQPLTEGEEIPQYRLDVAKNEPFRDEQLEARCVKLKIEGSEVRIAATRQHIIHVPPAQMHAAAGVPVRH